MTIKQIREQNQLVIKYEPLVNKIAKQFVSKVHITWDEVKSMAWEGLVIAFNTYDENRSKMSFLQFAGFAIRNNILSSLDNELRTVKMPAYAQKKAKDKGMPLFTSIAMSNVQGEVGSDDKISKEYKYGLYEGSNWEYGDVYKYLYMRLEDNFSERDCQIFYMSFGLKDFEITTGKDIAKIIGVSEACVTNRIKKIITFIRKDDDLCEMLGNL